LLRSSCRSRSASPISSPVKGSDHGRYDCRCGRRCSGSLPAVGVAAA
jgi:hypothetical protein